MPVEEKFQKCAKIDFKGERKERKERETAIPLSYSEGENVVMK